MGDWLNYLGLTARAKTGVSGNVLISGVVVAWAVTATLLWLSIALFLVLSERNGPITAAVVLSIIYVVITTVALIATIVARHFARQRAQAALVARNAALVNPTTAITVGLQVARAIGWRRLVTVAAVGVLAASLAKEWAGSDGESPEPDQPAPED
jgi:hypothetical protein